MVVRPTNRILIDMRKLGFNPCRIEPFLVQNRTHRVTETMPRYLPRVSNPLEHLIYTRFAHRFTGVIPSPETPEDIAQTSL